MTIKIKVKGSGQECPLHMRTAEQKGSSMTR
jgi:hypothetical protein